MHNGIPHAMFTVIMSYRKENYFEYYLQQVVPVLHNTIHSFIQDYYVT